MPSRTRTGELIALGGALLWSLFPIVTVITVSRIPPLFTAAISTGCAALFFAMTLTVRRRWQWTRSREAWRDMMLATFCNGIVFYGLVFAGYRLTSPGNGAVVSLMEIFFTFLIVNLLWKHERFVASHAVGALLMVLGALFILLPRHTGGWNMGDLLILLATIAPPIGNIYAQRARRVVTSDMLMLVRSVISAVFLCGVALLLEPLPSVPSLAHSVWFLLFNGIALLGLSKIFWMEALHRISISKTVALTSVEVLLTLVLAYLLLRQPITHEQLLGIVPMLGGIWLLTRE